MRFALLFVLGCGSATAPSKASPMNVATGQDVVTGTAANAKLGAVVVRDDGTPVYCRGLDSWPDSVAGKQVTAHGRLEQTDEFAADQQGGMAMQGTRGSVWVLRDCTYDPP